MNRLIYWIAVVLLLVNGIGALLGGFQLITDPSGATLQMPLSFLQHSPFDNYLIPGIILFTANGLLSMTIVVLIFMKLPQAGKWVAAQGIILSGWIIVQMLMLQIFYPPLHLTFLLIGLMLLLLGILMSKAIAK
ncbi:hypothetical protein [Rhodoflexus caldus]|uniref:hypothetical protein n=1 Tax=Rhodoflexus caldus TaxID=2891236 RepID=UPI00202A783E|nr:hypothetical protein [Rhodoflexus caldus]